MAKIWRKITGTNGFARASISSGLTLSMSEGDRLTGRYYFELTSVVQEVSVEVWSRTELALQSKTIPDPNAGIVEQSAMVFKGLTDGFSISGEMDVLKDVDYVGGGVLSYCQSQSNRQNFELYVEVDLGG